MTILLQHPITEKPEKPGEYWFEKRKRKEMVSVFLHKQAISKTWDLYEKECIAWYEPIELPDDAIIVQ
jgi:hypothetical protein